MTEVQCFQDKQWSQIVARAWANQEFKTRLLSDPGAVLREHGIELAPGVQAIVREATEASVVPAMPSAESEQSDNIRHFILPASPADDLSEEELTPIPVAYCFSGWCHRCHRCGRCGCGCYKP